MGGREKSIFAFFFKGVKMLISTTIFSKMMTTRYSMRRGVNFLTSREMAKPRKGKREKEGFCHRL